MCSNVWISQSTVMSIIRHNLTIICEGAGREGFRGINAEHGNVRISLRWALFMMGRNQNQTKGLTTDDWLNKTQHICMFCHHKCGKRTFNHIKILHDELNEKESYKNSKVWIYCAFFLPMVYQCLFKKVQKDNINIVMFVISQWSNKMSFSFLLCAPIFWMLHDEHMLLL